MSILKYNSPSDLLDKSSLSKDNLHSMYRDLQDYEALIKHWQSENTLIMRKENETGNYSRYSHNAEMQNEMYHDWLEEVGELMYTINSLLFKLYNEGGDEVGSTVFDFSNGDFKVVKKTRKEVADENESQAPF